LNGGASDVFNLGTGQGHSVKQVIAAVKRASNRDVPVVYAPRRAGDPAHLVADNNKAKRVLGFDPRYMEIEEAVRTAYMWHENN
jgi:UDP-glucose 4-epimerase